MSEEIEDIFGSKNNYQVTSAHSGTEDSIYNIVVKEKKMFPSMYHFFALGLVYGILHNKKSEKTRGGDIIRIDNISDEKTRDVINICYMSLNDGRNQTEIVSEISPSTSKNNSMSAIISGLSKSNSIRKLSSSNANISLGRGETIVAEGITVSVPSIIRKFESKS